MYILTGYDKVEYLIVLENENDFDYYKKSNPQYINIVPINDKQGLLIKKFCSEKKSVKYNYPGRTRYKIFPD